MRAVKSDALAGPAESSGRGRTRQTISLAPSLLPMWPLIVQRVVVGRNAGEPRPLVAQRGSLAHLGVEFVAGKIVPPAAAIGEFDEVDLPTLRQGEPSARDTVVRTCLPFRHGSKARSE